MEQFHRHRHQVSVRRVAEGPQVAIGGDGRVTLGNVVVKGSARKVRKLYHGKVLAGFAGATADAFTLFERFEAKLEKHQGHLVRAAIELAATGVPTAYCAAWRPCWPSGRPRQLRSSCTGQRRSCSEPEHGAAHRHLVRAASYAQSAAGLGRSCTTPSCPRRNHRADARWKSPAGCASTPTCTTPSKPWTERLSPPSLHRSMTPQDVAAELDRHIVGQAQAKRAVARFALRNPLRAASRSNPACGEMAQPDDRPHRGRQD